MDERDAIGTKEPRGELVIKTLAMPADTNPSGDIFGGWLLSQMDIGGGIIARTTAGCRVTTVAITGMRFWAPVHVGDTLERETAIASITPKVGRSGAMILVMLRHTITGPNGLVAVEEQDTVYLEAKRNAPAPAEKPIVVPTAAWRDAWKPDPVVLFRFSALAFNGHRIHYDADYARDVEGYPALVVNGSVSTLFLFEALLRRSPGAQIRSYEARTMQPVFCDRRAFLCGSAPDAEGRRTLWVESENGAMAIRIQTSIS